MKKRLMSVLLAGIIATTFLPAIGMAVEDEQAENPQIVLLDESSEQPHEHTYETVITKATTKKNGKSVEVCTVCGAERNETVIYRPKYMELSCQTYTYSGKTKHPKTTILDSNGDVIPASNYTITYPTGRKNVGEHDVVVTFKDSSNYSGKMTEDFTIRPNATSITKLTAKTGGFQVKWKKKTTQTTGYEIEFARDRWFDNDHDRTIRNNTTTSKTITGLKRNTTYYVRVRTYKKVLIDGEYEEIESKWSAVKKIKTK